VSDPYRMPGSVQTSQEREAQLRQELQMLYALNTVGVPPEVTKQRRARIDEIRRLLVALALKPSTDS
jgi:hypothetical protein